MTATLPANHSDLLKHRALLISYLFPPTGGAGVQRNVKYAKYLPQFGWQPIILTVKDINYHVYDPSLLAEIHPIAEVIRTESLDPHRGSEILLQSLKPSRSRETVTRNPSTFGGSRGMGIYRQLRKLFAFPDANIGWLPFAFAAGMRAIKKFNVDVIVASVQPFTSAVVAQLLSRRTGVPYVIDFRDGWTDHPYLDRASRFHEGCHRALERSIVTRAGGIIVYGEFLRRRLGERYPRIADHLEVVTNGFDPDDCIGIQPAAKPTGLRRIVYSGTLYRHYEPNFNALLSALGSLPKAILEKLEVVIVGRNEIPDASTSIARAGLERHVKIVGYVPHSTAISYLLSADACLLFLPTGDIQAYSGKIFEYFMVEKPIIASIEPQGTCAELLHRAGFHQSIAAPGDAKQLAKAIAELAARDWQVPKIAAVNEFSRKRLTERFAKFLEKTLARKRASTT